MSRIFMTGGQIAWIQVQNILHILCSILIPVGHKAKKVYLRISQYSSTRHIITNVKHLLEWRNVKHMHTRSTKTAKYPKQQMHVQRNSEDWTCNYVCRRKELNSTYSDCVFLALVIQNVTPIRCIILLSVACLALPHFSHMI